MKRFTTRTTIALFSGLGLAIGCVWLLGTGSLPVARALTYTITNTNASGPGSLRQAILDANANSGHDTINFVPSASGTIVLTGTLPLIDDDLTIAGPGPDTLSISGDNAHRVFEIASSTAVTISNLTIRDGNATDDRGGGIHSEGTLLLDTVDVVSNTARVGAGVYVGKGSATLNGTQIISNTATGVEASGGGLYMESGSVTLEGGQIAHNTASFGGGGVNVQSSIAVFTQTGDSVILDNTAIWGGGMLVLQGSATLEGAQIISNTASSYGGGVYVRFGGVALSGAQIISNTAPLGGGIYNYDGTLALVNTTVSGNRATADEGGGLYSAGGTSAITFTTVASNTAASGGYGIHASGGAVSMHNTIVAHNGTATTNCSGVLASNGHNLEYGNSCNLNATGDITDTNPLLNPLTYDSSTWVHPLQENSPAIDAGICVAGVTTDQRGMARLAPCDIGAYEWSRQIYLPLVLRDD